jgi:hypothetical protein
VVEDKADVVRRMFSWGGEKRVSMRQICCKVCWFAKRVDTRSVVDGRPVTHAGCTADTITINAPGRRRTALAASIDVMPAAFVSSNSMQQSGTRSVACSKIQPA